MIRILLTTPPLLPFHTLQALFPNLPPLNLQTLAGALRAAGHEVLISDLQHLPFASGELFRAIESFRPEVVGFSNSELANAPAVIGGAAAVRRRYPGLKLIAGGQTPTFRPELFLGPRGPFDIVALYEAEATVAGLVEALVSGRPPDDLPGAAWRGADGELKRSRVERLTNELDSLPFPHWDGTLKKAAFSKGLSALVETSRGCPYRCTFCSIPGFSGGQPRYKSAGRIMAELGLLKERGVTEVYFTDDSFATNPGITRDLFEAMIRGRLGMRFLVQMRADIIAANPDLMELGARAGMFIAVVGFEGYTVSVQTAVGKGNSAVINKTAAEILRKNGVAVYGTHVFGAPESGFIDNLTTFLKGRLNSDIFRMTIFTPLPGSRLYGELAASDGLDGRAPTDFYEGKYLIKEAHSPLLVELGYFGLQALHYALPDTLLKAAIDPDPVIREFNRRAYYGAFRFILGCLRGKPVSPEDA
jgi:radical SAM superfamily enzyme YgiQ (UPF0313 family)